jgi:outer membrane protease
MTVENADLNRTTEQKKNPQRMEISNIAGYQSIDLKWIVKGGGSYTVRIESVKGGRASAQTE